LAQQSVVGARIRQARRHRAAQADQQVFEIVDVIIDLLGHEPGFVTSPLHRPLLVVAQLAPQPEEKDGNERNDRSDHQAQELRADCAKQHRPRLSALNRGRYRAAGFSESFTRSVKKQSSGPGLMPRLIAP
jgi:hypothetical protein